jgi:hypothetical protein
MDATHADFLMAHADGAPLDVEAHRRSPLADKWVALHAAADVVASLAGIQPDPLSETFALALERTGGWRLDLARQGVDDIVAMMEPGLSALLTVHGQGGDPRPAACALWREFDHARQALLALAGTATEIG